jgi:hypothetical protein
MVRRAVGMMLQQPNSIPQETLKARVADLEGSVRMLFLELKRVRRQLAVKKR